jgi:hypothetical protein
MDLLYTRTAMTYANVCVQEMTGTVIRTMLEVVCAPSGATQRMLLAEPVYTVLRP